ncbi:sulfatase-like hydrolase/transferase [Bremerella sp. T1]|uniref:sulfatase-like hydrolase/transferase n=1 Tax=Bremerella sp. TYQ1 TaxID=3119568 RepID=UPI001CCC0F1B|nr:sulfatase-like hydrolase/transferase [Bremerella volcania]UBM35179.1 sulfatase-like hydrolase/transferase [Bremerella volcania]
MIRIFAWLPFCLVTFVSVVASADVVVADENSKPNILFLFSDDQSYETTGYRGMTQVQTPHLDELAQRSLSFNHAYNQGSWSGAVCVASRTMLNTGRFVWHANDVYKTAEKERADGRFWAEHLKKAGYKTYMTGKWHVPANAAKAFDVTGHVRGGMPKQTPQGYDRPKSPEDKQWQPWDKKFGGFWEGGKHWSEVVGDEAVGFLQQAAKEDDPFFMYIAFNAPHDPRQSPKEFVDMYPADEIEVPEDFLPQYPDCKEIGCAPSLRDEHLAPFPRTKYSVQVNRQEYYAIITHMDQQIGRILEALQQSGKADNTYVFFTSDHGLACGHHGLMGKQNSYDHSIRVPLLVSGPSIKPGENDAAVYLQDIMPTTLELAGIDKPEHVEFVSLLPLIRGEKDQSYDAIYNCYLNVQRSITDDGFKLMVYPKAKKVKLFDLKNDPQEMKDLAGDSAYAEKKQQLFATLEQWQTHVGDPLPLDASLVK